MSQEWFFYMLRCRDDSLYSGITVNIEERLKKHTNGSGAKYTAARRPVVLVYWEKHSNISEARKREAEIKRWSKIRKERLVHDTCSADGYDGLPKPVNL